MQEPDFCMVNNTSVDGLPGDAGIQGTCRHDMDMVLTQIILFCAPDDINISETAMVAL